MTLQTAAILKKLQDLPAAQQLEWLDQWSRARMQGREPPKLP